MARRKGSLPSLTPLELKIMQVLWKDGSGNVQSVKNGLDSDLAYTTVQTVLTVLHQKGRVSRKLNGRAYEYTPRTSKESAVTQLIRDVVQRFFGGSPEELVMNLVRSKDLNPEQLEALAQRLRDAKGPKHES